MYHNVNIEDLVPGSYYFHNGSYNTNNYDGVFMMKAYDFYSIGECTLDTAHISYIKLDSTWFLDFGFWWTGVNWTNGKITIQSNEPGYLTSDIYHLMINNYPFGKPIKYVHELQGMYSGLYRENLTKIK